jgi:hypothetical protein
VSGTVLNSLAPFLTGLCFVAPPVSRKKAVSGTVSLLFAKASPVRVKRLSFSGWSDVQLLVIPSFLYLRSMQCFFVS